MRRTEWRAGVERVLGSSWTSCSPVLTAATTSPSGWATTGAYYRTGAKVAYRFQLTAGASVTAGSGNYRLSLPLPTVLLPAFLMVGQAVTYDTSTGNLAPLQVFVPSAVTDYVEFRYSATWLGASAALGPGAPFTWADGDNISGTVVYEAALI